MSHGVSDNRSNPGEKHCVLFLWYSCTGTNLTSDSQGAAHMNNTGLEKSAGRLGQVNFPGRQVIFHFHSPNGQGPGKNSVKEIEKGKLRLAQGKQNLTAGVRRTNWN